MIKPFIKDKEFTLEDLSQALQLINQRLGENFYTFELLQSYSTDSSKLLLMAFFENRLCGVFTGEVVLKSEENQLTKTVFAKSKMPQDVAILQSLVVHNEMENIGIGKSLIKKAVSIFKKQGIDQMGGTVWEQSGSFMPKLLLSLGFRKISFVPNYWYESSKERNFSCPNCGLPPCSCTAVVYAYNV